MAPSLVDAADQCRRIPGIYPGILSRLSVGPAGLRCRVASGARKDMSIELTLLAWTLVLAFVQIMIPAAGRSHQFGFAWSMGPRDGELPPLNRMTARMDRARQNLLETLPIFATAVIILALMGKSNPMTVLATQLYLGGRVAYIPAIASGIPYLRSAIWSVSLVGLLILLRQILF
jgi:uncharacterized MAPEG superfamily protein